MSDLPEPTDDIDPIDMVEIISDHRGLDYDRISDDQIAMAIAGQWKTYSVTIAWMPSDETLRLICSFELEPPVEKISALYELLNLINDKCWAGHFTFWKAENTMVFRYTLLLIGEQMVNQEQIDTMMSASTASCERFYPAIGLVLWDDASPEKALASAFKPGYGRA